MTERSPLSSNKASDSALDCRIVSSSGLEIGAGVEEVSKAARPFLSVTLDDPSFPATIYARLVDGEDGTHILIRTRCKGY